MNNKRLFGKPRSSEPQPPPTPEQLESQSAHSPRSSPVYTEYSISTIRDHLFDHAFMENVWEESCARHGIEGRPSLMGTALQDIQNWLQTMPGFEKVRLYYSFELYMWATRRFVPKGALTEPKIASSSMPVIYTNTNLFINIDMAITERRTGTKKTSLHLNMKDRGCSSFAIGGNTGNHDTASGCFVLDTPMSINRIDMDDTVRGNYDSFNKLALNMNGEHINPNVWADYLISTEPLVYKNCDGHRPEHDPKGITSMYNVKSLNTVLSAASIGVGVLTDQVAEMSNEIDDLFDMVEKANEQANKNTQEYTKTTTELFARVNHNSNNITLARNETGKAFNKLMDAIETNVAINDTLQRELKEAIDQAQTECMNYALNIKQQVLKDVLKDNREVTKSLQELRRAHEDSEAAAATVSSNSTRGLLDIIESYSVQVAQCKERMAEQDAELVKIKKNIDKTATAVNNLQLELQLEQTTTRSMLFTAGYVKDAAISIFIGVLISYWIAMACKEGKLRLPFEPTLPDYWIARF